MRRDILLADEVYAIIGAAIEVHRVLGAGFLEAVYQEALAIELSARGIPYESEKALPILYKGQRLQKEYRADFVCYDTIIVELKAIQRITEIEEAQLLNYLKATRIRVGLIINFASHGRLDWRRMVL